MVIGLVLLNGEVGTNVGDISIWEVGSRERLAHKPIKVWDLSACSMPLQTALVKDATISINRCIWGPDGSILGVVFSRTLFRYLLTTQQEN